MTISRPPGSPHASFIMTCLPKPNITGAVQKHFGSPVPELDITGVNFGAAQGSRKVRIDAVNVATYPDVSIVWSWCWVVAMIVFAAFTVRRRAAEVPRIFTLALTAFGVASLVTLGVLFGLGVFELDARTLIPLAGLMIGNSMTATVLVARRLFDAQQQLQEGGLATAGGADNRDELMVRHFHTQVLQHDRSGRVRLRA